MSNIEELKGLAELKEQGILTEEEFQKEKEKILSRGSKTEEASPKSTSEPEIESSSSESKPKQKSDSIGVKIEKGIEKLIGFKGRHKSWMQYSAEEKEEIMKRKPEIRKMVKEMEKTSEELEENLDGAIDYMKKRRLAQKKGK